MNGAPDISLAGEMSFAATDYALVALAILVALGFLFRGVWRRRRGVSAACNSCPGCGSGEACQLPGLDVSEPAGAHDARSKAKSEDQPV